MNNGSVGREWKYEMQEGLYAVGHPTTLGKGSLVGEVIVRYVHANIISIIRKAVVSDMVE